MWEKEKRRGLYFYFSKNKILHVISIIQILHVTSYNTYVLTYSVNDVNKY